MIEIIAPAFLSMIVDRGRYGFGHIGVPPSSAMDRFACAMAGFLLGNPEDSPVLEIMGNDLSVGFSENIAFAITGAHVRATLDDRPVLPWTSTNAKKGSILKVREITSGLRYYIGFSGKLDIAPVMDSITTNLECKFGGFQGRPLMKGDTLTLRDIHYPVGPATVQETLVRSMKEPHILRVLAGPEADRFSRTSVEFMFDRRKMAVFKATSRLNRTGIRLEGTALVFKDDVEQSIISEGIIPGTVQVPPDGLPIINCVERTIGGYARLAFIIDTDLDMLAHIKPGDRVFLSLVDIAEADRLRLARRDAISFYCKKQ
jgi:antagonist of KipI